MYFKGQPNLTVMDHIKAIKVGQFDENGIMNKWNPQYTERLKKNFEVIEDAAQEQTQSETAEKKVCKKCGEKEFDNQGLLMSHYRTAHRKGEPNDSAKSI